MPKRPQERQEAAKRRQDSAEKRQVSAKRCQDAGKSDFGAILARFWTPLGGPKPSKTIEKTMFFKVLLFSKGAFQSGPQSSKRRPPGGQNDPQERPGAPQEAPRRPQETPGAPQERPKSRPRGDKKGSKRGFRSRGASGSHFEAIWERFWRLRGGILEPFWVAFSSLVLSHSRGCGLLAARCSWLRLPPCSGRKARREAAGTHAKRVTSLARPL